MKKKVKWIPLILITIFVATLALIAMFLKTPIKEAVKAESFEPLIDFLDDHQYQSILFVVLLQVLLLVVMIIPAAPIQVFAGLLLGKEIGFIYLMIGSFIGHQLLYLIYTKMGNAILSKKKKYRVNKLSSTEKEGIKAYRWLLYSYLVPAVPFGIIAYMLIDYRIKHWKYTVITTVGVIPSILVTVLIGSQLGKTNIWLFILISLLVISIMLAILKYRKMMKRDMYYFKNNIKKPNVVLYTIFRYIIRWHFFRKYKVTTNGKQFKHKKGPYVLLFNHPSKLDFMYAYIDLYPRRINTVAAYYYFCNFKLGNLLNQLGAFPKYLFSADTSAIRNIKTVINEKGIIGIAPEGRLSAYGAIETINPATAKLIKNLGVDVVVAKINGAYFTSPKWAYTRRSGKVEVVYQEVLKGEALETLSVEDIHQTLNQALAYDEFAWQEKNHITYKGKRFAEGLENILYMCPITQKRYDVITKDEKIICNQGKTEIILDSTYQFQTEESKIPKNIKEWYLLQKRVEKEAVKDPNYQLKSHVTLKMPDPNGKWFKVVGDGIATLDQTGLTYQGSLHGSDVQLFFKLENLPAIPFGVNENFEVYSNQNFYYFVPDHKQSAVQWSIVAEALYQVYIEGNYE